MNPPIPEPSGASRERVRGPRPDAMKYFIAGSLFITVINFIVNSTPNAAGNNVDYLNKVDYLVFYLLYEAIWLTLLRLLWKGHNWVRVIIMAGCALSVISIFLIGEYTLLQKALTIADAAFSAVFFWWLRTPEVVAFTKGKLA